MKRAEFFYELPEGLIAQQPLVSRDQARLMVVDRRAKKITHDVFANLEKYLPSQSQIVLNDSKVIPARLFGRREKTGGQVEIFLLKRLAQSNSYRTMIRPLKKLKIGEKILLNGNSVWATLEDAKERVVSFNTNIEKYLDKIGHMPLPPYIKRKDEVSDRIFYQTVYAKNPGSVAAPTAGLHFTESLLKSLKRQGHDLAKVTLHVNQGTFKPVETDDITQHPMHFEDYRVSVPAFKKILKAKESGRAIVAVGTTSCRVLESVAATGKHAGETNLFIYPGYRFRLADILITNFHLPYSTLLMLVYAFGSPELLRRAYQEAIEEKYRFYSYGHAMVIK